MDNENDFIQAKVLSRASKATGKFKSWYNVENLLVPPKESSDENKLWN